MNGLTVSLVTVLVTVFISFLVAVIVKLMTTALGKFAELRPEPSADTLLFRDESDVASVIAIALTLQK